MRECSVICIHYKSAARCQAVPCARKCEQLMAHLIDHLVARQQHPHPHPQLQCQPFTDQHTYVSCNDDGGSCMN